MITVFKNKLKSTEIKTNFCAQSFESNAKAK